MDKTIKKALTDNLTIEIQRNYAGEQNCIAVVLKYCGEEISSDYLRISI